MLVHTVVTPYRADWFIDVKIRIIACSRGTRRRSLSTSYLRFVRSDTVKRYRTKVQGCSSGPRKGFSLGSPPLFLAFFAVLGIDASPTAANKKATQSVGEGEGGGGERKCKCASPRGMFGAIQARQGQQEWYEVHTVTSETGTVQAHRDPLGRAVNFALCTPPALDLTGAPSPWDPLASMGSRILPVIRYNLVFLEDNIVTAVPGYLAPLRCGALVGLPHLVDRLGGQLGFGAALARHGGAGRWDEEFGSRESHSSRPGGVLVVCPWSLQTLLMPPTTPPRPSECSLVLVLILCCKSTLCYSSERRASKPRPGVEVGSVIDTK